MKTITLFAIAATTLVTSLSALADGATYSYPQAITSNTSRAEVRADLYEAIAIGALTSGELSYVAPVTGRPLTRNEVRTELAAARRNNELFGGEFTYEAKSNARWQNAPTAQADIDRVAQ
ncbi:DUF4148 domain-containing protein [Polaromonas sp.]|uniref:DUF4148 domain-containing protein n=1 Tax=Polaromonas sp. TaxID=1869339 RepID=UPI0035674B58